MNNNQDYSIINERHKKYWGCDDTPLFLMLLIAIYIFIAHLIPAYIYIPVNVLGASMESTLYDGDKVILYKQGDINYGVIVVVYAPDVRRQDGSGFGEDIIKRVMGLPGDTIWFEKQTRQIQAYNEHNQIITKNQDIFLLHREHTEKGMTVETVLKDEYYCKTDNNGNTLYGGNYNGRYTLQENEYFVMGDNRSNSLDSRSAEVGIIKKEQIIGKALFIIRDGRIFLFDRIDY